MIPAKGNDYTSKLTAPTGTEQGYTARTCSLCNDTYKDAHVDARGHTEVTKPTEPAPTAPKPSDGEKTKNDNTAVIVITVVAVGGGAALIVLKKRR